MRGLSCAAIAWAFSKRAAGLEIGGDSGRTERVASELLLSTEKPSRWPFDGAMPKRAASRMRGAPNFAGRKERAGARRFFAAPDKIGSPAPRCAAPVGVLDPTRSGMTGKP